jgi:hypothetical protein
MSYTHYPSFAPHTVLDWESYDAPTVQLGKNVTSRADAFSRLVEHWRGWMR